jgi:hypothetical protein
MEFLEYAECPSVECRTCFVPLESDGDSGDCFGCNNVIDLKEMIEDERIRHEREMKSLESQLQQFQKTQKERISKYKPKEDEDSQADKTPSE